MSVISCDNYFSNHIARQKYFSFDDELRSCAINTARTDLAACGIGSISEKSPEMLKTALYEQTLFVLCRQDDYATEEKEVISESIEGVGSCRYTSNKCPAFISPRAFALIEAYKRTGTIHLNRG